MIIPKHNSNLRRAVLTLLALIMTCATMQAQFGGGDGSPANPYLINNEIEWYYFCNCLNDNTTWNRFSGRYVKLGADIGTSSSPVTTMAGSDGHDFCGTFDGNGKTIHISLNSTGNYTGIFRYISNVGSNSATIKNLNVEGTVTANAGHKYAGGLVGACWGVFTIENCHVSTVINSSVVGDGTHGGIVGVQNSGTLTIQGCVFDGKLLTNNTNGTTKCAGFVGYSGSTVNITNCLYAPAALATGETGISDSNSATFVRNSNNVNNCYYTQPLGSVQGKVAYTRTNLPANIGSQSASYGNGNVIAYTNGFKFNGKYYVGSDSDLTVNSAGTEYTINTTAGWNYFCAILAENDKGYFTGKTVKLGNNITVSTMAGGSYHDFTGTFDGQGHTLTFNRGTSSQPFTEQYCAPFRYVEDAVIQNLHVDGHIYTSEKYAGGIAGNQNGTVTISNCRSSVIIHSSIQGDGTHGGIMALHHAGTLTLSGCIYDGRMLTTNSTTDCGGLVGYRGGTCTISDCLYAPTEVTPATGESYITNGATICRNYSGTPSNCYYTQPLGSVQGKVAYTRTSTPPNIGTQSESYGNGNVIAYTNGIKFNNTYYVGSDNNLTVNDAGTEYTINTAAGWNYFCAVLAENAQGYFTGKTVKLGANINITQSAGDSNHKFSGTFDGQEHTLTVNITDTVNQGTAPFRFISNATIRNLHVTGSVTGTAHAAGLVGMAHDGTILIEKCLVEANVNSTVDDTNGNRHCGGIVGHGYGGNSPVNLTLRNCVYTGTITCDKNYIGGLQGWSDGNTLNLENCLFVGNYQGTATGTALFHPIALRDKNKSTNLTATNVFAAVAPTVTDTRYIAAEGTKTTGRATAPAGLGTQEATYSFMNMTVYQNGLYYNGLYYVAPTLNTDSSGAYLINNVDDWTNFCDALYNNGTWNRFSGKTVKLCANITVTRMAGSSYHDFMGTFDGQDHTLTIAYGSAESPLTEEYAAPFRNLEGNVVIQNLHVDGHIYISKKYAGGIAGNQYGTVTISNCRSSVIIHSSKPVDGTHGGIVANQHGGALTLSGCVFDGRLLTTKGTTDCGGLVGYHSSGTCSISDCLYAPVEVTLAEGESYIISGATFCRNNNSSLTITNCYYTQVLGAVEGRVAYTRTETPDNIGTPGTNHGMVQAYTNGLEFNSTYYVGSDSDLTVNNAGTMYTINTTAGWNYFCAVIAENDQGFFTGKTVKLGNSITVASMAGTSSRSFSGTFDGSSDTLTFNYGSLSQPFTEEYCAPFRYTKGAIFNNLCVGGTIYTSQKYAAGIVSSASDSTAITNCRSSIHIISSVSSSNNDGTHGGFIACTSSNSRTSITGCVFDGSIESANPSSRTTRCGGFVGWNDNTSVTIKITNCLLAADMSTISNEGSCTFVRPYNGPTITNSYYITVFGATVQGTQVYSITKGEFVTTLENAGTISNNYTTSGLTFYNVGLQYGNVLYAPANNYVSLTLNHVNRESDGWFFDQYTVSAGTLTGTDNPYTLFMHNSVVTISANYYNSPGGCLRPTNLSASNITDSSATLNWTSNVGNYEMAYALNSGTAWISVTGIDTTYYMLTALNPQTTYKVRVRANCDTNSASAWSDIIIFTTQPGETPPGPTDHPSIENLQGKPQRFRIFRGLEVNGKQQPADWTNPDYWTGQGCPTDNDTVVIQSGTICKVTNMEEIHYKKLYIIDDDSEMREQDQRAGQLLLPKGANVEATLIKRIHGWHDHSVYFTQHDYGNITFGFGNWYLISFPTHVEELEDPNYLPDFEDAGMITSELTYDLFFFQQAWWDPMMNDYYNLFDGGPADPTNPEAADGYKGCWRNYRYYLDGEHFFYDETEDATYWYTLNDFKADHNAYLYANYDQTDLHFTGPLYTQDSMVYRLYAATNADDVVFGTNLLGNPYPCNARITVGEEVQEVFYQMEIDMNSKKAVRCDVMPTTIVQEGPNKHDIVIAPMTAVFFLSNRASDWQGDGPTVTFKPYDPDDPNNTTSIDYVRGENVNRNLNQLCIEVHEADTLRDRVYVKTGEGSSCSKFIFNPYTPKLFVPMGDKDYALAYTDGAKVMPLNFIYQKHGTYTLTFDTEAIECDYLHLIDNATGIDIDLYQTPSYTFNSSDCNYATRFKIVFSEEATNDIAESFAYISNGNLVINNSGNATLQVMDITGRILSTESIHGCHSKSLNLSTGLYIVRLSNGNDMKTQKIVVR